MRSSLFTPKLNLRQAIINILEIIPDGFSHQKKNQIRIYHLQNKAWADQNIYILTNSDDSKFTSTYR